MPVKDDPWRANCACGKLQSLERRWPLRCLTLHNRIETSLDGGHRLHCAALQEVLPDRLHVHAPRCLTPNPCSPNTIKQRTHRQFQVKRPMELGNHNEITSNATLHCSDSAVCRSQYMRQGSPATPE